MKNQEIWLETVEYLSMNSCSPESQFGHRQRKVAYACLGMNDRANRLQNTQESVLFCFVRRHNKSASHLVSTMFSHLPFCFLA